VQLTNHVTCAVVGKVLLLQLTPANCSIGLMRFLAGWRRQEVKGRGAVLESTPLVKDIAVTNVIYTSFTILKKKRVI